MRRSESLKENYEFRRVYHKGKFCATSSLVVYSRPNHSSRNRLGMTVSVKLGGAVVRNRIRRRMREIFRSCSGRISQGYDFVLVARNSAVTASYWDLNRDFSYAMTRLALWQKL